MKKYQGNVAQLHTEMGIPKRKPALMSARRKKRALLISGIIAVITLVLGTQLYLTKSQLNQVNAQIRSEKVSLKKQKAKAAKLKQKTKLLQDEEYVKDLAHTKYGYSQKGETSYRLSSENK